ncbi:MAG: pilus assembly FimT family protein [Chthoniobacterales bacterium]
MQRRCRRRAFTLIEISISIFILLLLMMLAVPSMSGVMADRRLRRSLDSLNKLVRMAQERSVVERRVYLIAWEKDRLELRPAALGKDENPAQMLKLARGDAFVLNLPAALVERPPAQWAFWPTGTCEPAEVTFKGVDGTWTARYAALTALPEIEKYVAK